MDEYPFLEIKRSSYRKLEWDDLKWSTGREDCETTDRMISFEFICNYYKQEKRKQKEKHKMRKELESVICKDPFCDKLCDLNK